MRPWRANIAALLGAHLPGVVLLIAAFAKAASPGGLSDTLRALHVPSGLAEASQLGVIVVEAGLGSGLVAFARDRRPGLIAITIFAAFSIVLVVLLLDTHARTCHCFGAWNLFESRRLELSFGILRNCLLTAGIIWSRGVATHAGLATPPPASARTPALP